MPRASVNHGRSDYTYGARRSGEAHGVVLTKPHIVSLILDLAGYRAERDLTEQRLLDPACGQGAFLLQAAERLLISAARLGRAPQTLAAALRAYDVDPAHVQSTRRAVSDLLIARGVARKLAVRLSERWIEHADFLLCPDPGRFDYVVGNPPYVRIEQLPAALQAQYRSRYETLYDRADLYVAFIERALRLLGESGVLSFICADRWTLNRYGAPLRALITGSFRVHCYVDLHRASPFESEVIAYPSIVVLGRGRTRHVPVARLETGSAAECAELGHALVQRRRGASGALHAARDVHDAHTVHTVHTVHAGWFTGDEPWVLSSPEHLQALRMLERRFAPLEASARVGIGVATGHDQVYIVDDSADIEPSRLLPLVMRKDLVAGTLVVPKRYVINTFERDGQPIALARYPRLRRYLLQHAGALQQRHVARKAPARWFRTIDRVYEELVGTPKLLIPDIAGDNALAYDRGLYYPHHNLYFVTSQHWDLELLGALLCSRVALFFVWSYAVKMRGGYLRFQAQYLRRIRVPARQDLDPGLSRELVAAFRRRDFAALDALALRAYGLRALPELGVADTRR